MEPLTYKRNKIIATKRGSCPYKKEEYWLTLNQPNKTITGYPRFTSCNKRILDNFYVPPILIKCGAIPKKQDLEIGATYLQVLVEMRNEAVWNGEKFVYKRTKFNCTYLMNKLIILKMMTDMICLFLYYKIEKGGI